MPRYENVAEIILTCKIQNLEKVRFSHVYANTSLEACYAPLGFPSEYTEDCLYF